METHISGHFTKEIPLRAGVLCYYVIFMSSKCPNVQTWQLDRSAVEQTKNFLSLDFLDNKKTKCLSGLYNTKCLKKTHLSNEIILFCQIVFAALDKAHVLLFYRFI